MFSQACVILFTGGGLPQCILGYHHPSPLEQTPQTPPEQTPPWEQIPPRNRRPLEQTAPFPLPRSRHPPPEQTHPPPPHRRAICEEIRSTRGRYASYWNAILFENFVTWIVQVKLSNILDFAKRKQWYFRTFSPSVHSLCRLRRCSVSSQLSLHIPGSSSVADPDLPLSQWRKEDLKTLLRLPCVQLPGSQSYWFVSALFANKYFDFRWRPKVIKWIF